MLTCETFSLNDQSVAVIKTTAQTVYECGGRRSRRARFVQFSALLEGGLLGPAASMYEAEFVKRAGAATGKVRVADGRWVQS